MMKWRLIIFVLSFLFSLNLGAQKRHIVQRGETFATVAKKYNLTESELAAANPTKKVCYAGLNLVIPEKKVETRQPVTQGTNSATGNQSAQSVQEIKKELAIAEADYDACLMMGDASPKAHQKVIDLRQKLKEAERREAVAQSNSSTGIVNRTTTTTYNTTTKSIGRRKLNAPVEMKDWYFKTSDGKIVIKFNLSMSSINAQVPQVNTWGLGVTLKPTVYTWYYVQCEPGTMILARDYKTTPDYFEFRNKAIVVRVARDQSWVQTMVEGVSLDPILYSQEATKDEFTKYYSSYKEVSRAINGGMPYTPNNGSISIPVQQYGKGDNTCRVCHGTGVCTSCGGTGGKLGNIGYYTGSNVQTWINCPSCNGNKKCFNCFGTGRQ